MNLEVMSCGIHSTFSVSRLIARKFRKVNESRNRLRWGFTLVAKRIEEEEKSYVQRAISRKLYVKQCGRRLVIHFKKSVLVNEDGAIKFGGD